MKRSLAIAFSFWTALFMISCDNAESGKQSDRQESPTRQYIVAIDLSESRNPQMLKEAKRFLNEVIENLSFKDRIVLLKMQESGLSGKTEQWQKVMPSATDQGSPSTHDKEVLSKCRKGAEMVSEMFFEPRTDHKILHTDIFTTLDLAGESAHDSGGRRTELILLSDMLQSDAKFEMDHLRRMPDAGWIARQKQAKLLPNLSGSCVLVVGADPTNGQGAKIREFWEAYFAAAGASLKIENYRATPPSSEAKICD